MKILADENIEQEFIEALREADFEVISVRESYIGSADDEILQTAVNEKAIIMTYDTDFGELVFRFGLESNGVILLRLHGLSLTEKTENTIAVLRDHADELENAFTVISENSVRIRKSI
jgi:predicted nuclease of predicted toxin-antitoxin system